MTTLIKQTVRRIFKKTILADWYSHDEQHRFHHEMGELQKDFYRQGR